MDQKINRKMFKDIFAADIERGIKEKFAQIYQNQKITVDCHIDSEWYFWCVYVEGRSINKQCGVVARNLFIDRYNNIEAVELFSSMDKSLFEKEYNDYSEDNYQVLRDGIQRLVTEYEKKGVIFEQTTVTNGGFRVVFYHPEHSFKEFRSNNYHRTQSFGHFSVQPITLSTAKSKLSQIRRSIEYLLRKERRQ